jgi:hypothetical protein
MTMTLIETKTLGAAAASIEFTSIPQDGTDLVALLSQRNSGDNVGVVLSFNTGGAYTRRRLLGDGSATSSDTPTNDVLQSASVFTANTFSNSSIYVPNYTGSTSKSYSVDTVTENNATTSYQALYAGLWDGTAAITTLKLTAGGGFNFVAGSTVSLYKVTKGSDGIVTTS